MKRQRGNRGGRRKGLKKVKSQSDMSEVSDNANKTNQVPLKRKRSLIEKRKRPLTDLEVLENELIEIGEIDIDKLVLAGKSIFDSARRCLKGGKKRKVIQLNNIGKF